LATAYEDENAEGKEIEDEESDEDKLLLRIPLSSSTVEVES
jgi:hypothetical protein